jgi:hypothetical protein
MAIADFVAGRDDPGGKAAAIRKPLHHVTDHADVYDARADSTQDTVGKVKICEC